MKQKLYTFSQSITSKENASIGSIVLIGIIYYTIWTVLFSFIVFEQFTWTEIISVAISFIIILSLFARFFTDLFQEPIEITLKNGIYGFILFVLMCLLSSTVPSFFYPYANTYPLLEAELGLGWHKDTVYHVSHIQSILNFGYPSIGLHGAMLNPYHVLSHYVDALVVFISGVEPFDSYGLLMTFKKWLLISSIAVFMNATIRTIHPLLYIFIFLFIAPIFTADWYACYSHGLWFTTILIIFSSLKIFHILTKRVLTNEASYFMFVVIILISLGKISSGVMFASLVGLSVLIKYPKEKRVYILGLFLAVFFFFYIGLFTAQGREDGYNFSAMKISHFYNLIFEYNTLMFSTYNIIIHISLLILLFISLIFKHKHTYTILIAGIFSYFILIFITIKPDLNPTDQYYFYLGFYYILGLFTFQSIVYALQKSSIRIENKKLKTILGISFITISIYISSFYSSSKFSMQLSIFPAKIIEQLRVLNTSPFIKINKKSDTHNNLTVKKLLLHQAENRYFKESPRPLYTFRNSVYAILAQNNIAKNQALLYVPKEIYEDDRRTRDILTHAKTGMPLLYAVTGIPLLYAVYDNSKQLAYGLSSYNKDSLWKKSDQFSLKDACKDNASKTIIQLLDIENLKFNVYKCKV